MGHLTMQHSMHHRLSCIASCSPWLSHCRYDSNNYSIAPSNHTRYTRRRRYSRLSSTHVTSALSPCSTLRSKRHTLYPRMDMNTSPRRSQYSFWDPQFPVVVVVE
ncbi:hypothetical protein PENTCL1PPCAC_12379 [Pristionchus entomophagus]|uniref:Uncharacterized protein n=1 Tax=Pristionchus entomophagus TaxID=358040 RepID=A0AAV5TBX6_9BILA|nr:hypothetical protein PENTCL1PPCAC_12379 [Pristionchus entomophagus]